MQYDTIIIGGGPSGLTMAHTLSKIGLKILLIDKHSSLGGCHRVQRIDGYFSEHSPRIYSSAYVNFIYLLKEMNVNFYDMFVPYNFQFMTIGKKTIFDVLSFYEILVFMSDFLKLTINNNYGNNITLKQHLTLNKFDQKSIDVIDKICRLTDGAGIDRYLLNEFLQIFNQQSLYKIYQPSLPNDKSLFKIWRQYLENNKVDFLLNTELLSLTNKNNLFYLKTNNGDLVTKKIILAVPPINLVKILGKSSYDISNSFGHTFDELKNIAEKTKYNEFIQITFHWSNDLKLPKIYGFPTSEWGVAFIVLSDYMKFDESKTVISAVVTIPDKISDISKKTLNESTKDEIIEEVIRVINISYPNLVRPDVIIFNPNVNHDNKKWISDDTAYVSSFLDNKIIPFESSINGLYNVGTHNNRHLYKFTSMESAVTNAFALSHIMYPELINKYQIKQAFTVINVIHLFIIICLCILFLINK